MSYQESKIHHNLSPPVCRPEAGAGQDLEQFVADKVTVR